jgi:hypothetical protein
MNIKVLTVAILVTLGLTACGPEPKYQPRIKNGVEYKLLETHETESGLVIRIVCIDSIKYIRLGDHGIAPKYQAYQDSDPMVEECE